MGITLAGDRLRLSSAIETKKLEMELSPSPRAHLHRKTSLLGEKISMQSVVDEGLEGSITRKSDEIGLAYSELEFIEELGSGRLWKR